MTCLLVLDQIIEDRKRRVQLEVLLLVLLQLLCSIVGEYCSVYWKIVFHLTLLGLFWLLSLSIDGAVVCKRALNFHKFSFMDRVSPQMATAKH